MVIVVVMGRATWSEGHGDECGLGLTLGLGLRLDLMPALGNRAVYVRGTQQGGKGVRGM